MSAAPKTGLSRFERLLGLCSVTALASLLLLFHVIKIEDAVTAFGTAAGADTPHAVQSFDGGIVKEILVADGDAVAAGDVLIRLDPSALQIRRDRLMRRMSELLARRARLDAAIRDDVAAELRQVRAEIEDTRLDLAGIDRQLQRLDIVAPVAGIIHQMQSAPVGGVVPPQATLLTVVPGAEGVTFNLEMTPEDIDRVHLGQPARVRFPAFEARMTLELSGAVSGISPDRIHNRSASQSFYRVQVKIPAAELVQLGEAKLWSGMPVEARLQTQKRSVLSFLVKPFTDHMALAFRDG